MPKPSKTASLANLREQLGGSTHEQRELIQEGVPVPWPSFKVTLEGDGKLAPRLECSIRLHSLPDGSDSEDYQTLVDELGSIFRRFTGEMPTSVDGSMFLNYDPVAYIYGADE